MSGRSLRILLLYDQVYPYKIGGVEHRNRELALALAERGHHVVLAGWAPAPERVRDRVELRPLGGRTPPHGRHGRRRVVDVLRYAARMTTLDVGQFDLIETANIPYAHVPWLARRCRREGIPLLVTWHELWGSGYWLRKAGVLGVLGIVAEALALRAGRLAAVSELTRRRLQGRRPGQEVALLPNGCDADRVRRAAAGSTEGAPLIHAGRLIPEKRVDLLVQAIALLGPEIRPAPATGVLLEIVGEGPERRRLEHLAHSLGAASRVRFRGRLDRAEDLWAAFGASRIAVQPSSREGFGLFPLEAMAAGLPVVHCRSASSAVGDLVRNGVEGIETAPDPSELARALELLLHDRERWQRLRGAALKRAREYDWEAMAGRAEAVFTAAIERQPRGGHGA